MSDTNTGKQDSDIDTNVSPATGGGSDGQGATSPDKGSEGAPADVTVLEKRLKDTQAKMTELAQQNAELRRQHDDKLATTLDKLSEAVSRQNQPRQPSDEERRAKRAELVKRLEEEGYEGVVKLFEDAQGVLLHTAEERLAEQKRQFEDKIKQLESMAHQAVEQSDPEYIANKQAIDRLVKDAGLSREQAKKTVKLMSGGVSIAAAADSPAGMTSAAKAGEQKAKVSAEEMARWRMMVPDASEAEIKRFVEGRK
jgi:hypothetical protein